MSNPNSTHREQNSVDDINEMSGIVSYAELERKVFRPNNYLIDDPSYPIPKLHFIEKPTCAKVSDLFQTNTPPKDIEESKKAAFLLNGYANLYEDYNFFILVAEIIGTAARLTIELKSLSALVRLISVSVLHALNSYPLKGMKGIVIGSEEPWVEMYALLSGAEQVISTVASRRPQCSGCAVSTWDSNLPHGAPEAATTEYLGEVYGPMPLSATSEVGIPWLRPFTPTELYPFSPGLQPVYTMGETLPVELVGCLALTPLPTRCSRGWPRAGFRPERSAPPCGPRVGLAQAELTNPIPTTTIIKAIPDNTI
ncbi:unnamed protein product [Heligmosomoides polygyrus]|uniref:Uncharacterized protein n=1 Tax=Heligmosomoides polygyrus TaxID=6339 RepID=A0A3P8B7S0_HELPZ|nr:unnamed protein product [Heligmosomoides polygyrus]